MRLSELSSAVGSTLSAAGATLATAESCSGGLLASSITDTPGSSGYYLGGVVSYSNQLKVSLLGVAEESLRQFGAVSSQTVQEMALGARKATGATYALATSGIAGPGGGSPDKPVGLVYIGLAGPVEVVSIRNQYSGDRSSVKEQTVMGALQLLLDNVVGS